MWFYLVNISKRGVKAQLKHKLTGMTSCICNLTALQEAVKEQQKKVINDPAVALSLVHGSPSKWVFFVVYS